MNRTLDKKKAVGGEEKSVYIKAFANVEDLIVMYYRHQYYYKYITYYVFKMEQTIKL